PKGSEVRVEVATHDEHVVVSVVDRGDGIAQAHVAQIFEPFFTTKPDGTGLGLAICRSIATSHDGELGYRRVGDTTRFELRLPSK
ncbi:MAG: HAMP domain-containing histidine kinase, partial [Planctomycetes bacterium]|nr:HAMP domain-containing histidine kinase [Planctomycetota bacterium]